MCVCVVFHRASRCVRIAVKALIRRSIENSIAGEHVKSLVLVVANRKIQRNTDTGEMMAEEKRRSECGKTFRTVCSSLQLNHNVFTLHALWLTLRLLLLFSFRARTTASNNIINMCQHGRRRRRRCC